MDEPKDADRDSCASHCSSSVETLIAAMRVLSNDIQSDDGVANAAASRFSWKKILKCESFLERIAHDRDDGATCSKCGKDLGWYCNISPKTERW